MAPTRGELTQTRLAMAARYSGLRFAVGSTALGGGRPGLRIGLGLEQPHRARRAARAEGMSLLREAVRLQAAAGPDRPNHAFALDTLAQAHMAVGEFAQAEPLLFKAGQILRRLGEENPDYRINRNTLADLYAALGRGTDPKPADRIARQRMAALL